MKKLVFFFYLCMLAWFLHACAQEQPLVGGPEDLTPPSLVASNPKNLQTQVITNKIQVTFDRFVNIANPYQQVVIAPRPQSDPEFKIQEKGLRIHFKDSLRENTTYIIQFGESVTSFREPKAITENLKLVFSTGASIDSAVVMGKTYDAHEGVPLPGAIVGLYDNLADSIPKKEKPLYFSKSDSLGNFRIENLAKGKYQIVALLDANKSLMFNSPKDKVGFTDQYITIENNQDTVQVAPFWVFEEESTKQFVRDFKHEQVGKIEVFFNVPFRDEEVTITSQPKTVSKAYWNKRKDSLSLWVSDVPEENPVKFTFFSPKWDSIEPISVRMKYFKSKQNGDGEELDVEILTKKFNVIENGPLIFEFSRPIQTVSLDKIKMMSKDSVRLAPEDLQYKISEQDPTIVGIYYPWKNGEYYSLELFRNAFIDAYNQTHTILRNDFTVGEDKSAYKASIKLKVNLEKISQQYTAGQYIVELLKNDKTLQIIHQKVIKDKEIVAFEKLDEGSYKLRMIMDKNGNGRWDTGNYDKKIQPEYIFNYPSEIIVKANFDQEIDWNFEL